MVQDRPLAAPGGRSRRLSFRPDGRGRDTAEVAFERRRGRSIQADDTRWPLVGSGGGGSMTSTRVRLASLVAATAIVVGACSSTPAASGPAGSGAGSSASADCQAGAGAKVQIPDVVSG